MENTNEGPSTYRPRTGSMERRKTVSAPKRAVKSADEEEPRPKRAARKEKEADEAPVKRASTRQSFFKNRTPQAESREESFDEKPKRAPRKAYGDGDEKPRRSYGERSGDDKPKRRSAFDAPHGDKPERKPYERKSFGEKPFAKKSYGEDKPYERKPYAKKTYGDEKPERKPYARKTYGDDKDKPYERKPYAKKTYGDEKPERKPYAKKSYGDEKPYERKPYAKKAYGDENPERKPYARKSFGDDKPFERKPYGKKSFGEDKPYERKPYAKKTYGEETSADAKRPRRSFEDKPRKDIRVLEPKARKAAQVKDPDAPVRLNKFIANSGVCSRREADEYIQNGEITVNGAVVTELGTKVLPSDEIRWNGDKLSGEKKVYILLNKPKGYVTTVEDPHADKTVMDLIAGACPERVYPVGRLDKNTTGVLLFTNDGELTKVLTHPSYNKRKVYQVNLDKTLKKPDMDKLVAGVELEDGLAIADEVGYTNLEDKTEVGIEIHSGRNRVVRRMFEALGYEVKKLDRVYFAGLTKKSLERGKWRILTPKEVNMLKMGAYE